MPRGGLLGLLDALVTLHARDKPAVLGIVFATTGSTYQKPGAIVLLDESGLRHGVISGGCLEPELEDRARAVLQRGRADTIDFDMRTDEDVTFGSGTGCQGRVRLALIPQPVGAPLARALLTLAEGGEPVDIALQVDGANAGSGRAWTRQSTWSWGSDGDRKDASIESSDIGLHIEPPPRVLLLGAGAESVAFRQFVLQLGWMSVVVEHRGRWLGFAQRAGHDEIIERPPHAAAEIWRAQRIDAAVAMSHNYSIDLTHLALCADSDIGYIGLLGPAARREKLLEELGENVARRLRDRLHAPVGLPLGGWGPDVLALSIAAELQRDFSQRTRNIQPIRTANPR